MSGTPAPIAGIRHSTGMTQQTISTRKPATGKGVPMGQLDTTTMRVPPVILHSTRQLVARLEAISGRRLYNRDALHVAIVAAENATDEQLISYLPEREPELTPCE